MTASIPCPLCSGPTEEHEAYRDRACPKCGLSAPPDVLERIAKMVHADGHAWAMEAQIDTVRELFSAQDLAAVDGYVHEAVKVERAVCRARIAALEAELAQLKQQLGGLRELIGSVREGKTPGQHAVVTRAAFDLLVERFPELLTEERDG